MTENFLPANWRLTTLENVAEIFTGNSINEKVKQEKYFGKTDGLIYIATKDIGFDTSINYDTNIKIPEYDKFKIAPKNTPLLCIEGGSSGKKVGFTNQPVCFVNKLCAFVATSAHSKFIFYFLQSQNFLVQFNSKKHGLIGGVSIKNLAEIQIPLPPLAEQKRIIERLDNLFEKLDAAKKILQDIVDGYELRRAAILHHAFTGELTEDFRKINNLSLDDWQEKTLGNIADVKGGKRIPKGMRLSQIDTGHPYIKAGNLKKGTVIDEGIMYVPIEIWHYIKRYTVSAGDVYITNVGACIGDCGVIPEKYDGANLTENAVKITKMQCDGKWLSIFLSTNGIQEKIKNLTASATLGKLSIKNIKNLQIPFPSLAEQKEISRAFRGELGTNDHSEITC